MKKWSSIIAKIQDKLYPFRYYLYGLLAILILVLPFLSSAVYFRHLLIMCLVYITLASSLNIIMGYTGQLALGHAAFYGVGAYAFTLLVMKAHVPYWIAFLLGGVIAACVAVFLGAIVLRFKGGYLAVVTLAFGEIVRIVIYNWVSFTRGPMGLTDIPRPVLFSYSFSGTLPYYYLALCLAVFSLFVYYRLINSRYGRAFISVRDEENASLAMGIRTTRIKILAFVIGCFFAGLAGSFLAGYIRYIHPDNFTSTQSLILNAMVVIGGEGNMIGSIIGAVLMTLAPEVLRVADQYRMIIYAIIMISSIILFPHGVVGAPRQKKLTEEEKEESKQLHAHFMQQADADNEEQPSAAGVPVADTAADNILVVKNLTKVFGGLVAVNDVSLKVPRGGIHSVIGPNGAGKSTFFNTMFGFYEPQSGSVAFNGAELVGLKPDAICRLGMARTFQKIRLFWTMTVLDNVMLGCDNQMTVNPIECIAHTRHMKKEEKRMRENALEILEYMGLADKRYYFASNLSYGDQRRLEIARALATGVKLLLLDEPTAGMSPEETADVIRLIRDLRDHFGLTIILIEHDMKVVMGISDEITVLDHGTKIAEGKPADIQNNERVIEAYLGPEPEVVQ